MSKGSAPRPYSVKPDEYAARYCMTFGHKYRNGACVNCQCKQEAVGE